MPSTWAVLLLAAAPAWAYGVAPNACLRGAERESPTLLTLYCGPAIRRAALKEEAAHVQVASPTDPDFQVGVSASTVRVVKTEPDGAAPEGYGGPRFERYTLAVELPADRPLKPGQRYWVRLNSPGIAGFNRRGAWIVEKGQVPPADLENRHGLRECYLLAPRGLHAIAGPGLDVARLKVPGVLAVTSPDDPEFKAGLAPVQVSRRSNLDFYIPDQWPWIFQQRHELFLFFEKPFQNGRTYTLDLNAKPGQPLTCGAPRLTFRCDDRQTFNLALKVNQIGYLPEAKEKYAYLGMWMGELNAYAFGPEARAFEVRDAQTHEAVLKGAPTLRRKATYRLVDRQLAPDPKQVKGPETVYQQDLSYEDVYQLDLGGLTREGTYYIALPGMGRSFEFRVARDVYLEAFRALMNGIYHQRSGLELKEPWTTHYQPAGHRQKTEYSTLRGGGSDSAAWTELPKHATDGKKHDLWGGHHDAGDWNPRSHLDVAEVLFLLYELNPGAFSDGQLNIPERANGIPDVLDEGLWALDLWTRLQDEDGGVHHGIESAGDPKPGDTPATDSLREFAFAKDSTASYRFAAVAAQAAFLWRGLGQGAAADGFLQRAQRAWAWALQNPEPEEKYRQAESDQAVFAAVMLLRATGEERFAEAFKKHSIYARTPDAPPCLYQKHDQMYGSFHYARYEKADPALKAAIVASFEKLAVYWKQMAETTTYRYMRNTHAPNTWGTGGLPVHAVFPVLAERLTGNAALAAGLAQWRLFSNDFSLGCHPMNLVFTVGLGKRYVHEAFHHLQSNSPGGPITGLQSEGAGGHFTAGDPPGRGGMGSWPGMSLYPPGLWPDLYKFSENASPGMNEGVVSNQVKTAFAYGLWLPPAPASAPPKP